MLGMMSVAKDLDITLTGQLWSDSSAAIGIAARKGLGKVKHLHTQYLWLQERVKCKDFSSHKEHADKNLADVFTKYLDSPKLEKFVKMVGYRVPLEKNQLALKST